MLDGFYVGSKYNTRTKKQKLETRFREASIDLIIDRNQSFLKTARKGDTSIIVNNRDGLVEKFIYNNRQYISIPSSFEDRFDGLSDYEADELCVEYLKAITTECNDIGEKDSSLNHNIFVNKQYKNITGQDLELDLTKDIFQYRTKKEEDLTNEDKEEIESESQSVGTRGIGNASNGQEQQDVNCTMKQTGNEDDLEYSFEDTELNPDGSLPKDVTKSGFYSTDSSISPKRELKLKALSSQIVKSFNGRISKQRTSIPSKRLISKALISDNTDKLYQNKKGTNGKHLNVNLIIDMSGSMSGVPVKNAVEMIYIFNEIAIAKKLNGCVIWSEQSSRTKIDFPMPRALVRNMNSTGGSEGLGRNMNHYVNELKKADVNICMTDGQLCDDPILKSVYEKANIDVIGVYVNKKAKDLTQYTNSLDRWFTRSLVRRTTEELCEKLIALSLRKKGK